MKAKNLRNMLALWGVLCLPTVGASEGRSSTAPDAAAIVEAFTQRMAHAQNLHFKCESKVGVYTDEQGSLGKLVVELPLARYEYWQFNDSNRQDSVITNPDGSTSEFSASFDAERGEGVTRSVTGGRPAGYISSSRDPLFDNNRYRFWLNVRDWGQGSSEYLFTYAIDHKSTLEVSEDPESDLVIATTDYLPRWSKKPGKRTLWLNPLKGLMPERGEFKWSDGRSSRWEKFEVVDSEAVGAVWMPKLLKEHVVVRHPGSEPIHNLHTITVTKIEQGTVSASDLSIEFPPNTEFVDAVRRISFIGDQNGNPVGAVEALLKRD